MIGVLAAVLLSSLLATAYSSAPCTVDTEEFCKATCELDGTTYKFDISEIADYPVKVTPENDKDVAYFEIHPCSNAPSCDGTKSSICVEDKKDNKLYSGGTASKGAWKLYSVKPYNFTIEYSGSGGGSCEGTDCRESRFIFTEDKSVKTAKFRYSGEDAGFYLFKFSGSNVGQPQSNNNNTSTKPHIGYIGFGLIVLFLMAIVAYVIVGMLVMRFTKGAVGVELVPNIQFWLNFPGLVKSGILFTLTPCFKLCNRKPKYDAI